MTTSTHDTQGRPWAKLNELKPGDKIELDDGFICTDMKIRTVFSDEHGLYFFCNGPDDSLKEKGTEHHYLDGQADDGEHCVGVYKL